ncbi:uncharacterized protein LOC119391838 [Rhipicephalus sanguineus]|uniref:uncharacterized protein LOC119391838 n=1 Tax=Rhipicephalus sanguineus TaxID=34632 RepID=UPI0018958358|nr:uncharacterized protein LOC119391838 [Rhipicephalus sanguineus]
MDNFDVLRGKTEVTEQWFLPFLRSTQQADIDQSAGVTLPPSLEGQTFLLVVDYYSRFPEVVTLRSTTARAVIDALKSVFARHGIPQDVRSDNGPPFSLQEFAAFAASYGFNHATSSPHYAQSNGEAERMLHSNHRHRSKFPFRNLSQPTAWNLRSPKGSLCNIPQQPGTDKAAQENDPVLARVRDYCTTSWPKEVALPPDVQRFQHLPMN